MARASIRTKLSLDRWAFYMGISPLHFNQVRIEEENPFCGQIIFQYPWQNHDHVGREEIAQAIAETESKIESWLGYHLAPDWDVDEWHYTQRPYQPELVNTNGHDIRGYKSTVNADWGYFISGGREAKTLVEAGVAIVYTDEDTDGYDETATVTVATVALDPGEMEIYYPDKEGDSGWEIRNTKVSIAGGNATIIFRREQAVIPEKLEVFNITGAEAIGTTDADFLEEVDVYRHYNDPQSQVSFLWEPLAAGCACNGSGCPACAYSTRTGCLILRGNPRTSIVGLTPADWNSETLQFDSASWGMTRMPDIARLYYYSGWRDKGQRYPNRLSEEWERTIAYMAAASLDRPPCDCSADTWVYWRQDYAAASVDVDSSVAIFQPLFSRRGASNPLDNPFGSKRGQIDAWRKVAELGLIRATAVAL